MAGGTRGVDGFDPALLRQARRHAGLSQERLGLAARVARQNVGQLENGRRRPQTDVLARLARALNVPIHTLLAPAPDPGLKQLRTAAGLLQQQAAAALGLRRSAYAMLESGRTAALDQAAAAALAAAFGVEPSAITEAHRRDVQRRADLGAETGGPA